MAELDPPTERVCERCGREDAWDDAATNWIIQSEHGDRFCIHEWDINGEYCPVRW